MSLSVGPLVIVLSVYAVFLRLIRRPFPKSGGTSRRVGKLINSLHNGCLVPHLISRHIIVSGICLLNSLFVGFGDKPHLFFLSHFHRSVSLVWSRCTSLRKPKSLFFMFMFHPLISLVMCFICSVLFVLYSLLFRLFSSDWRSQDTSFYVGNGRMLRIWHGLVTFGTFSFTSHSVTGFRICIRPCNCY